MKHKLTSEPLLYHQERIAIATVKRAGNPIFEMMGGPDLSQAISTLKKFGYTEQEIENLKTTPHEYSDN